MIVEREYYVKLSEIGKENKITNKALLGILEDIGGVHSNIAGYGIPTMDKTHLTWILLDWKVQVIRRPNYAEKILARTWSKEGLKYYAYRDFEVVDEQGNIIVKAISRWVLVNIETGKMERITDEILSKYQPESNKCVFEDETFDIVISWSNLSIAAIPFILRKLPFFTKLYISSSCSFFINILTIILSVKSVTAIERIVLSSLICLGST